MIELNLFEINHNKHIKIIENTDKIIAMQKEGKKTTEIAKEIGVSHATIYHFLIDHHVIERKRKPRLICQRRRKNEYEKKLKPFMERISPELRAKIKKNTEINNKNIKRPGSMTREEEKELVGSIAEMTITNVV